MPREYIQNNEIVENIQITFVILYKKPLAKDRLFAYNKDKKQKGDGVAMLKLHTLAAWMHGFLDPDYSYYLYCGPLVRGSEPVEAGETPPVFQ